MSASDTLATLLRVRRGHLDEAQRIVAEALERQQSRQRAREEEESRYAAEVTAALDLASGDEVVDAFARWLPLGKKALEAARSAEREAACDVDRARVALGLTRAAHRAVELLVETRQQEARLGEQRRDQHALDDIVAQRGRSREL